MFCKNCGKKINDNMTFCPHCGTTVTKPNTAVKPVEPAPAPAPVPEEPVVTEKKADVKKPEKKTNVLALVGFVLSICNCLIFSWLNYRVYICTTLGAATLTVSIIGFIFAEKKGYNFKGLALAGLLIGLVEVIFYPLYELSILGIM